MNEPSSPIFELGMQMVYLPTQVKDQRSVQALKTNKIC